MVGVLVCVGVLMMGIGIVNSALVGLIIIGAGLMVGSGAIFLFNASHLDLISVTNTITWITYGCLTMLVGGVGITIKARLEPVILMLGPVEIEKKVEVK